jgi:Mrp family chromosome partitioning ATPase/uncharacterized protein involved in exopolysaccharide biosynthesis
VSSSSISTRIERVADRDLEVSPRESLTRIFIRPWLFAICVLLPPLIAVGFTSLVPTTYKASVRILIRYGASEAAFLRDLVPENRAALSGLSSAEILRSLPSVLATVKSQGITEADIAKSPKDILSGLVSRFLPRSADSDAPVSAADSADAATLHVAEAFKASLSDSTGGSSSKPVEVLEKGLGSLPTAQRGDDLITMTVPSFNRAKVAAMANGLAASFIAEYAQLSAAEAHRSVVFLDKLIDGARTQPPGVRLASARAAAGSLVAGEGIDRQSPLIESAARELAAREADLARLGSMYAPNAAVVVNARAAVASVRSSLGATEQREVQKYAVEQLRLRRYQAANTEQLFRDGLAPISIVEAAVTPARTSSASRYLVSGAVGLALGLTLGLCLIVVLSVSDQRLHTSWDVERATKLPLLGALPVLAPAAEPAPKERFARFGDPAIENALLQLLGRLDVAQGKQRRLALAVTSAAAGEGKTFVLTGLAALLARGGRHKVLLVDADLRGRSLSLASGANVAPGFIDAMLDAKPLGSVVRPSGLPGVDLVPAGRAERRPDLGFYRDVFEEALAHARKDYDFVLVDTTAVLDGNESMMCGTAVDALLWVASSGTSRRPLIRAALGKLKEVGLDPIGVVLNRRREYLPSFVWRNV